MFSIAAVACAFWLLVYTFVIDRAIESSDWSSLSISGVPNILFGGERPYKLFLPTVCLILFSWAYVRCRRIQDKENRLLLAKENRSLANQTALLAVTNSQILEIFENGLREGNFKGFTMGDLARMRVIQSAFQQFIENEGNPSTLPKPMETVIQRIAIIANRPINKIF